MMEEKNKLEKEEENFNNNELSDRGFKQRLKLARIEQIPKLAWIFLTITIIILFIPNIKEMMTKMNKFKGYGIEIELQSAFDSYNKSKNTKKNKDEIFIKFQRIQQEQITNRVTLLQPILQSKKYKILWIDDHPVNNIHECKLLNDIGFTIETASSSVAGLELYEASLKEKNMAKYDLIISDYGKDDLKDLDGVQFASSIKQIDFSIPIIFYSSSYFQSHSEKPDTVYAVANRPDFLINYVLDVIERGETPYQ